jgi:hypothetical protein
MSTVPYIIESVTETVLKDMARLEELVAQGDDEVRAIREGHIFIRDTPTDSERDSKEGEKNINKPALIITYLGTTSPPSAGQNCEDDTRHRLLIQLVDDVPPVNSTRRKTYHFWLNSIRKNLQGNPYRAELASSVADIFLIQVTQISPAGVRDYRVHGQMRAGLEVTAYAREPRT